MSANGVNHSDFSMDAMFSNMTLQNDSSLSNATEIDPGPIQISWKYYVPPIIFGFIFLVGVAGNFLVIYVVALFKKMRTVTTYYLVNLAVTDLAFLLCCVPFTAVNYVTTSYVFGQAMCKFVNYLMQVTVQATCLTLALLSLDRYIAILHPMLSLTFRRKRVAIIGSAIIWIASFIMTLPTALYYRLVTITWHGESLKICRPVYPSKAWERGYRIYSILFLYFLPLAVCLFTCSAIVYRLYNRFQPDTNQMDTQRKKQTRRTACMVIGVVAVFAVCWLPNHVINLWAMLTEVKEITNALYWIKVTALILTYTSSATNPFIYAMAGDDFRTCVKTAFCAAKEKKQPGLASRSKTPKTTSSSSGRPLVVPAKLRKSPVLVCVEAQTVRPHIETKTTV